MVQDLVYTSQILFDQGELMLQPTGTNVYVWSGNIVIYSLNILYDIHVQCI